MPIYKLEIFKITYKTNNLLIKETRYSIIKVCQFMNRNIRGRTVFQFKDTVLFFSEKYHHL